jgi:hypothetical protein
MYEHNSGTSVLKLMAEFCKYTLVTSETLRDFGERMDDMPGTVYIGLPALKILREPTIPRYAAGTKM